MALPNVHPGEILQTEFMEPLGLTSYRLAKDIGVTATRVSEIVRGERAITLDTALRLGRYFNMTPQFWLNLQNHFDMEELRRGNKMTPYENIHPHHAPELEEALEDERELVPA